MLDHSKTSLTTRHIQKQSLTASHFQKPASELKSKNHMKSDKVDIRQRDVRLMATTDDGYQLAASLEMQSTSAAFRSGFLVRASSLDITAEGVY